MNCGDCVFFKEINQHGGYCYRYPPAVQIVVNPHGNMEWHTERPFMNPTEFCGEFKDKSQV